MPILLSNGSSLVNPQELASTVDANGDHIQHVHSPDTETTGSINANGGTVTLVLTGGADWAVRIGGTFVGTIQIERSINGVDYDPINAAQVGVGTFVQQVTGPASLVGYGGASVSLRVRAIAWTSGTATVTMRNGIGSGAVYQVAPLPAGTNVIGALGPESTRVDRVLTTANSGTTTYAAQAGVTTEALINLSSMLGGTASNAATAFAVTAGKRFRVTGLSLQMFSGAAAIHFARIFLRVNTAGAASATSPVWGMLATATNVATSGTPAAAYMPMDQIIPAGAGFGVSHIETATTTTVWVNVMGYEF